MDIYKALKYGVFAGLILCSGCRGSNDTHRTEFPVNVEVQMVSPADEMQDIAYSGTIEESETIPLSFSELGSVAAVHVSEGDAVKKGQLLAELNSATYRNSYEMAMAAEERAEDAHRRLAPMYKNGNLPEVKYVEVETALQQARSAAAIAKKSLDDCSLYAPTNGIVGRRALEPGMMAMPNVTSITIVKISKVYARVAVPENEISLMKKGQKSTIRIGALGPQAYTGTVEEIGVMADPIVHTYKIKIEIPNTDGRIKPGMGCNVTIASMDNARRLVVPGQAMMVDEVGRNYVYAVDTAQRRATRKYVTPGRLMNNGIEVVEGLSRDELVVVSGQHKLVDQSLVHIVNR